ncbi:MAG: biopolymer transporter ExbD [bacterium]|nr:biopolymer transporter ExbD [bacterium]
MRKNDPFAEATTSLIDIAFIIILFLIVSTVIAPEDVVPLKLPNNFDEGTPYLQVDRELIIHVRRSGAVEVSGEMLADSLESDSVLFQLTDAFIERYKVVQPDGKVILRADSGAVWDRPVQIMQACGKHAMPLSIALEPADLAEELKP